MQYIIMDMEWNNAFSKRLDGFMNEIIEIGAVKLDEEGRQVSTFSHLIRARIGKKLHSRTKSLTNITNADIAQGDPFEQVMAMFRSWAGNEPAILLTWGDADIRVLIENIRYFTGASSISFLHYYADLQRVCQKKMKLALAQQIGLSAAAQQLDIPEDEYSHHRALDDSRLSAECFRRTFDAEILREETRVCDDAFYARLAFKAHVISDIDNPLVDRSRMHCRCDVCGGETQRVSEWKFVNQSFRAFFYCPHCDRKLRFHIRFKKYYDRVDVREKVSVVLPKPPEEAEEQEACEK